MKKLFLLILLTACGCFYSKAEDCFSFKFGKISPQELNLQVHPTDSTAEAMYVFRNCTMKYAYNDGFGLHYEIEGKIKVFNQKGIHFADITIPYLENELITNISATTYNLEKGKVVKTKLEKKYIFDEQVNKNRKLKKISIPAVKEGSVFEYKYILKTSDIKPDTWMMQQSIPVKSSELTFIFPEYFLFNIASKGSHRLTHSTNQYDETYQIISTISSPNLHTCKATIKTFKGADFPAIKNNEPFSWYPKDYRAQIIFELQATNFPNSSFRSYSSKWSDIDKLLLEDSEFGKYLSVKNPLAEEMKTLQLTDLNFQEKVSAVFNLVKSKVSWNKDYHLIPNDLKKALKEGAGSNATINMILMAALRDAGIASLPVLLSCRDRGLLPFSIPSISGLNTFILCLENEDKLYYLDASMEHCWLNSIPANLRIDRGRVLNINSKVKNDDLEGCFYKIISLTNDNWVNLQAVSRPSVTYQMTFDVNPENRLSGKCSAIYTDVMGLNKHRDYLNSKDSAAYIEDLEKEWHVKIDNFNMKVQQNRVVSLFDVEKEPDMINDQYIYLNPQILANMTTNQHTQQIRQLPIEFPHLLQIKKVVIINIPKGYEVEEIPQNTHLHLTNNGCEYLYLIQVQNNQIILNSTYRINRLFFPKEQYDEIKNFSGYVADKNKELIILRKTQI